MIATDQRGSPGGGANITASNFRGSEVFCCSSGATGPVPASTGLARIGGQVEQKMFRLRICSTSLP